MTGKNNISANANVRSTRTMLLLTVVRLELDQLQSYHLPLTFAALINVELNHDGMAD